MYLEAIYVGRVSPELPDELVKRMLTACGGFQKWSRTRDPATDVPVSFGFADFATIEGVWRAARAMNGLKVADDTFIVNVPQKTKQTMDRWHAQQLAKLRRERETNESSAQRTEINESGDEEGKGKIDDNAIGGLEELRKELEEIAKEASRLIGLGRRGREASDKARVQRVNTMKQRISAVRAAASTPAPIPQSSHTPTSDPVSSDPLSSDPHRDSSDLSKIPPPPIAPENDPFCPMPDANGNGSGGGDGESEIGNGRGKEATAGSRGGRQAGDEDRRSKKRKDDGGVSETMRDLLERQRRRVSNYEAKMALIEQSFEGLRKVWAEEVTSYLRQGQKTREKIEQSGQAVLPTRKDALEMLAADGHGRNVYETLNYLYTIGTSPLYPAFNGKALPGRAPHDAPLDRFNIIDSRSWLRAVAETRAAARKDAGWLESETVTGLEKRLDAFRNERTAVLQKFLDLQTLSERNKNKSTTASSDSREAGSSDISRSYAISPLFDGAERSEASVKAEVESLKEGEGGSEAEALKIPGEAFAIDWNSWASDSDLRETFAEWLLGLSRQLVGDEDCQELTEYILDFVSQTLRIQYRLPTIPCRLRGSALVTRLFLTCVLFCSSHRKPTPLRLSRHSAPKWRISWTTRPRLSARSSSLIWRSFRTLPNPDQIFSGSRQAGLGRTELRKPVRLRLRQTRMLA